VPRPINLSIELLQTFARLIDNGGDAAKTAVELKINQPSMSKRLRFLQHRGPALERPWVERNGKTWQVTEEGTKALPAVRELVDRSNRLTTFVNEPEKPPDLAFACGRQEAAGFVQKALHQFRTSRPNARIRIATLRGAARIEGVANGTFDLATTAFDPPMITSLARRDLHVETIRKQRLALVCSTQSPWRQKLEKVAEDEAPLAALAEFPLILPEPESSARQGLDELLRNAGLMNKLDIEIEVGGWSTIMAYVQAEFGVGVVSESSIPAGKSLVVRYFDPRAVPLRRTELICRRDFKDPNKPDLSAEAALFYAALKTAASSSRR
jgi:DNA-binding transcriptional LysR family regulator